MKKLIIYIAILSLTISSLSSCKLFNKSTEEKQNKEITETDKTDVSGGSNPTTAPRN
ncbi:MAG: hypothetical protein UR28_C0003G0065 [Candidatus Peregrinibacteria bacterium GW2011_GWF2_33_10]|nr:MAG: hypothetical protein UR28_C0003G0065 [Candidatus Peregrinibacteria bacterium GW2011_GWF2_33_10]